MTLLRFDGACKGNPGKGGSAAVIYQNNDPTPVHVCYYYHPSKTTNNITEYTGLLAGLKMCLANNLTNVTVEGDSKLVIEQVFGSWACKHSNMIPLCQEAKNLKKQFTSITGRWIPRDQNQDADYYSNLAIQLKLNQGDPGWFTIANKLTQAHKPPKKPNILAQLQATAVAVP